MALLLTCRLFIGPYEFDRTSGVEIESSWKNIGDSATVKMFGSVAIEEPDGKRPQQRTALEGIINVGDPVEVQLGYDGQLRTEFSGYVAEVKPGIPFEIRCEDEVFRLKRTPVNKTWKRTTLRQLLKELLALVPGPPIALQGTVQEVSLNGFRADRTTVFGVLNKLKEEYLLCAYFRKGNLFVGLPYTEFTTASQADGSEALYSFQQNIVSDNLSYRRKQDVRIKAKVIAMHANGKKTTTEAGDADGEERTLTRRTEETDKQKLRTWAEQELAKFKYDGYKGTMTTFGVPYIMHSGVADLLDEKRPERGGRYLVNRVKVSFGPNGFRREVELGPKATY